MSQTKINVGMIDASSIGDAKLLQGNGAWVDAASPGWEFVEVVTASTSSTIELGEGNISAGYSYQINCIQVKDSVDLTEANSPILQYGTSSGPTYQTSGYTSIFLWYSTSMKDGGRDPMTDGLPLIIGSAGFGESVGGAGAGEVWEADVWISDPATSSEHMYFANCSGHTHANQIILNICCGYRSTAEVITGFRIKPKSGTFESGKFVLSKRKIA